jgi:hypothetical protein
MADERHDGAGLPLADIRLNPAWTVQNVNDN